MIKITLIIFPLSIFLNLIFIRFSNYFVLGGKKQIGIQTIHKGQVSRLGGLSIFLPFTLYVVLYDIKYIYLVIVSSITLIPALLDDLGYEIKPIIRLFCILVTSFFLISNLEVLPKFNAGDLNIILNNYYFQIVFFSFAITALTNGQNIIDGTNGLSGFTSLVIVLCIFYIGLEFNNTSIIKISSIIILLLTIFLIFNFPYGKIFLGDSGSYILGIVSGYLIIYTFGEYPDLSSWIAVIILFYPITEVIFSFFRKIIQGKSPFHADDQHLHLKLFFMISKRFQNGYLQNALIAPFLSIIWITPLAFLPLAMRVDHLPKFLLLILLFIYFFYYIAIPKRL